MALTPERKVKVAVRKMLEESGAYYVMPVTGGYGNSGAPDFLVCTSGRFVGIECKAGGNKPTALQEKNLQMIRTSGGVALVIDEHNLSTLPIRLKQLRHLSEKQDEAIPQADQGRAGS